MKWYQKSFYSCMARRIVGRGPSSCSPLPRGQVYPCEGRGKKAGPNKTSSWNRTRGVVIIWVAFLLFAIVLIMGLGLDRARLYMDAHQLQNAADSAALAAAQYVKVGYLAGNDPDPNNDYQYPAVVFRTAQELAKQHVTKATRAIVNLDVPNPDAFDPTVDVVIGYYRKQARDLVPYVTCSDIARVYPSNVELFMMLKNLGVFTPYDPGDAGAKAPNAVAVLAQQTTSAVNVPVPLIFGSIVDADTANVQRLAIALSTGSTGAGLIALEEYPGPMPQPPTGLQIGGKSTVNVSNGDVQVNSFSVDSPKEAFRAPSASFELDCEELNVVGDTEPGPDDPFWDTQDYSVNAYTEKPLPDPLAHIPDLNPLPAIPLVDPITGEDISDWTDDIVDSSVIGAKAQQTYTDADGENWAVLTLAPGYYPGGIRMTSPSTSVKVGTYPDPNTGEPIPIFENYRAKLELQPGIYALGGDAGNPSNPGTGLYISGGNFEAVGVMLYITQSQTGVYGEVNVRGGTQVSVKIYESYNPDDPDNDHYPGCEGMDYEYMAIFQDRNNFNEAYINGSSEIDLRGTLYFKNANFHCGGSGLEAGTQLVAGTVEVDGGAVININYDGRFFTAGFTSVLVE